MEILVYNELQPRRDQAQFERVCEMLRQGNCLQAEVKKLSPGHYYRAKLNDSDRLLFSFVKNRGERFILLLEIIYNHEYDKSRFLRGAVIDEAKIQPLRRSEDVPESDVQPWVYRNPGRKTFHLLDRPLSFDEWQESLFHSRLPLIIVGSAGSGKTVLSLEKLKTLPGRILYVTRSEYLADNARRLYSAYGYDNPRQSVDFLSFGDLLKSIRSPQGRQAGHQDFMQWLRDNPLRNTVDSHQLFEEFSGVLTGSRPDKAFLSLEDYVGLGVRQSIFPAADRPSIHEMFESWRHYLDRNQLYMDTMLCHDYLRLVKPSYDYLIVDEVQDLTIIQLQLALRCLTSPFSFLLCGDSNQIVHPNFFSWSAVKSLFFRHSPEAAPAEISILHSNYRNSRAVTDAANQILRLKVARFGSVDKESNFLVDCVSEKTGAIQLAADSARARKDLNDKTAGSVHHAVIVLRESDKALARQVFKTPLIFTVREAKGLEYQNVIIFNLVSSSRREFDEICRDVDPAELTGELKYARGRDKTDKSLEIFKFFINSLYVSVTRAIDNLYWLERDLNHPLFRMLGLKSSHEGLRLKAAASTSDEWRKEAARLAAQGKSEQASRILTDVLKIVPVPWEVAGRGALGDLFNSALDTGRVNSKSRAKVCDYAQAYHFDLLRTRLQYCGFRSADDPEKARRHYEFAYYTPYNPSNRKTLQKSIDRYGVDFRDAFNRTPLMMACEIGDTDLAEYLLKQSADPALVDNHGNSAYHYLLRHLSRREDCRRYAGVYEQLEPQAVTVRIKDCEIRIGKPKAELFFLNAFWALLPSLLAANPMPRTTQERIACVRRGVAAFRSVTAAELAMSLPDYLVPDYRKKQQYCSSILAKNELSGTAPYNLNLFYRIQRGNYILNPFLEISHGGRWIPWDELMGLPYATFPGDNLGVTAVNLTLRRFRRGETDSAGDVVLKNLEYLLGGLPRRENPEDYRTVLSPEDLEKTAADLLQLQEEGLVQLPGNPKDFERLRGKKSSSFTPFLYRDENLWQRLTLNYQNAY